MKISTEWLNEWIDLKDKSTQEITQALNQIGLEVDSCQALKVADDVVVAKVLECQMHENSDHLHVCKVDVGNDEILQIVCGAPNVKANQMVACAREGAKIGDITIKKAKLRGVESCGMLCSARELGLGDINEGIMVLDDSIGELIIGKPLNEYSAFNTDIIEIELTPNRGDCLSVRGISRDLAAKFDLSLKKINFIKKDDDEKIGIGRLLSVSNTANNQSAFFYKIMRLNDFSLNLLTLLRLNLLENANKLPIKAILQYATYSSGVIFRAYDYEKIAKNNEKISLKIQAGKYNESLIYANDELLAVAGIHQNDFASVDKNSQTIIIEASYTPPQIIATSLGNDKNQAKDEITYRTLRGSEPELEVGTSLLFERLIASSSLYGGAQIIKPNTKQENILINANTISQIIGLEINKNTIIKILKKLNFEINTAENDALQFYAKAPLYRHDIQNAQDICEEVVRIIGIDNISPRPLEFAQKSYTNQALIQYKQAKILRQKATMAGFFECVHYVFDDESELRELGFAPCSLKIANPITNELSALKPTLLNALLNSAIRNAKNGKKVIKLFEYGEVFSAHGIQSSKLAFISSGLNHAPSLLNGQKGAGLNLFNFVNDLQKIFGKIELKKSTQYSFLSQYESADIYQNGVKIGFCGRFSLELKKDLPTYTYVCEIDFDKITQTNTIIKEYSRYPAINRDLSLLVSNQISYDQIKECINSLNIGSLREFSPVDKYKDESLGSNASLSISFSFQDNNKTLVDDEINAFMEQILNALKQNLGIDLR